MKQFKVRYLLKEKEFKRLWKSFLLEIVCLFPERPLASLMLMIVAIMLILAHFYLFSHLFHYVCP